MNSNKANQRRFSRNRRGVGLLLLLVTSAMPLFARSEGKDYFQAVEAEAKKIDPASAEAQIFHDPSAIGQMHETINAAHIPVDSFAHFADFLRLRLHGSYGYFKQLPPKSQREVFDQAKILPRVPAVRSNIVDRYFGERRLSSNH